MIQGIVFDLYRTLYDPDNEKLIAGAREILEFASSRVKLCLISRKEGGREQIVADLGIEGFFTHIELAEDDKEPRHFQACVDSLGVPASDILVVGDRVKGEIALGNAAGMTTAWYKTGKYASELPSTEIEQPDTIITQLSEVRKFLDLTS